MAEIKGSNYWDKRAIRRALNAEKGADPYNRAVQAVYTKAQVSVNTDIEKIYRTYLTQNGIDVDALLKTLSPQETLQHWVKLKSKGLDTFVGDNYKYRITRLEQMQGELYAKIREITQPEVDIHTASHVNTINNAYNGVMYDTSQGLGQNVAFGGLDTQTVDTMLNQPWLGANYSQRVWGNTDLRLSIDELPSQ